MASPKCELPKTPRCAVCNSEDPPSRCASRRVVWYCSRAQQTEHCAHACTPVKKSLARLSREEQILREKPSDFGFEADPFTDSVGHFWGILETRSYMRTRFAVFEALLQIRTRDAVRAALEHAEDLLRLCRSDNMGICSYVPALYLRLGHEQACYDFVQWWCVVSQNGRYDWGNTELPCLDIKRADVFEPFDAFVTEAELSHATQVLTSVATDLDPTRAASIVQGRHIDAHIQMLEAQVATMYRIVHGENNHFWPALLGPGGNLSARPETYSTGSRQGMQLALQQTYDAWAETPGSIEAIRAQSKR